MTLHPILIVVFLPFVCGILTLCLPRRLGKKFGIWAAFTPIVCLAITLKQYGTVIHDGGWTEDVYHWIPSLGFSLNFMIDGLSMFFCTLIAGIGLLVVAYAYFYLEEGEDHQKFYCYLLLFMGSMLGVVSSNNLMLTFCFWECTSMSSFLLIGYWFHKEASRYGATKALVITGLGGLAMLGGFILLNIITKDWHSDGTWIISEIIAHGAQVRRHALYAPMLLLVFLGAATKSAQFPFHIWLPNAMEAPTPISAYLHSATMVKAGLFLVARLHPALSGTPLWFCLIAATGMITMCAGGILAICQTDLKALLAYSTISQLGMIMCMLGLGTQAGVHGAVVHIANHASFKAALFMCVGIIDHGCGTRDLKVVRGLLKVMPTIFVITLLGCLSMAGVPFLGTGGFISKELFYESMLHGLPGTLGRMLPSIAVFGAIFTVAYCFKMVTWTFFGEPSHDLPHHPHAPSIGFQAPAWILIIIAVALGPLVGMFQPALAGVIQTFAKPPAMTEPAEAGGAHAAHPHHAPERPAAHTAGKPQRAAGDRHAENAHPDAAHEADPQGHGLHLGMWHGMNKAFQMSLATLLFAGVLIAFLRKVIAAQEWLGRTFPWARVNALYNGIVFHCDYVMEKTYLFFQSGYLYRYLISIMVFVTLSVLAMAAKGGWHVPAVDLPALNLQLPEAITIVLIMLGIAGTLLLRNRIAVILSLGMTGFLVAFLFELIGAPDLALTQYLIETISTLLFLLIFWFLPPFFEENTTTAQHARDVLIAVAFGVFITVLMIGMMNTHLLDSIFPYYTKGSKLDAGGTNVVNVIIVDYRGFDTMWEISVLSIATIGIFSLLKRKGYGHH